MKKLSILGSPGSIGTQTLEIVSRCPDDFCVEALTCRANTDLMKSQIQRFQPRVVSVGTPEAAAEVERFCRSKGYSTEILYGDDGNISCAGQIDADIVVAAMVGVCGLAPVVAAIESGKDVALANKETLVAGGSFVMPLAKSKGVRLLPVDSEHSAIWQCLFGQAEGALDRILLTASGGPFFGYDKASLDRVTVAQALNHPTWHMGGKITVDSATMMNKGLEVIEASWLFDVSASRIDVVVHRQSVIHSMVRLRDGSVLAQMGKPDMMMPIEVALYFPERGTRLSAPFDPFADYASQLTFEKFDPDVFIALPLAYHASEVGGSLPAVMNSANEEAVNAFMCGKTSFPGITRLVASCMTEHERLGVFSVHSVEDVIEADRWARQFVCEYLN